MAEAISNLATRFLDATVNKWGTDEKEVDRILKEVHDRNASFEFETAIVELSHDSLPSYEKGDLRKSPVMHILNLELSGSALARAKGLYKDGKDSFQADRMDYFLEGVSNTVDLSDNTDKAIAVGATLGFAALATISAPAAGIVGGVLILGAAAYGLGKIAVNAYQAINADSEKAMKENLLALGEGVGITASALPFLPKGTAAAREGMASLRLAGSAPLKNLVGVKPIATKPIPEAAIPNSLSRGTNHPTPNEFDIPGYLQGWRNAIDALKSGKDRGFLEQILSSDKYDRFTAEQLAQLNEYRQEYGALIALRNASLAARESEAALGLAKRASTLAQEIHQLQKARGVKKSLWDNARQEAKGREAEAYQELNALKMEGTLSAPGTQNKQKGILLTDLLGADYRSPFGFTHIDFWSAAAGMVQAEEERIILFEVYPEGSYRGFSESAQQLGSLLAP